MSLQGVTAIRALIAEVRGILDALETLAVDGNSIPDAVAAQDKLATIHTPITRLERFLADAKDARDAD